MKQAIKCALFLHTYEVYKEEAIVDVKDNPIEKIIICRCKHCGRIKENRIITNNYYK